METPTRVIAPPVREPAIGQGKEAGLRQTLVAGGLVRKMVRLVVRGPHPHLVVRVRVPVAAARAVMAVGVRPVRPVARAVARRKRGVGSDPHRPLAIHPVNYGDCITQIPILGIVHPSEKPLTAYASTFPA